MKKIFPLVLAGMVLVQPAFAQTAPSTAAKTATAAQAPASAAHPDPDLHARFVAAEAAMQAFPAEKMVDQMLDKLAQNPQAHMSAADIADLKASIDIKALNKTMLTAMVKTFTAQELKAMGDFYGSATGQAILQKMPVYMSLVMPSVQQQVVQSVTMLMKKRRQQGAESPGSTVLPQH
jgi:hypothetical protein